MTIPPGARLGPYEILSLLGSGGMGDVYKARDVRLDRNVAVKTLRQLEDEPARRRFRREARALANLNHPNICQIFEIGEQDGRPFIAMELLEGNSLASRVADGPLPLGAAIDIAAAVLAALKAMHEKNLVHRDVKPSNVFLSRHAVKLLDFGLARPVELGGAETRTSLSVPGTVVGTPDYMSPEQITAGRVDGRSDLFSTAVMLFEMVTGSRPFRGDTQFAVLHAILHHEPPALEGSREAAALQRVIRRALAKSPDERYESAEAMERDLREAKASMEPGVVPHARHAARLAVTPFVVADDDPDLEFFATGLADALAASLSQAGSLTVRSTLMKHQSMKDAPDLMGIARELDVDALVTGTIIAGRNRIRVTTQIVQGADGRVLWSRSSHAVRDEMDDLESSLVAEVRRALRAGPLRANLFGADAPGVESLAVLPLENLSGDPQQEYFADGMTDALITEMARLGGLKRVIARGSVMRYKRTDKPLDVVARELRVDALVTGTVTRAGDRVRVTAQLIDGASEDQLWADRYERDLHDVLRLQNEVATSIAAQIGGRLGRGDRGRPPTVGSVDPEAYEAYLKARFHWYALSSEGFETALGYLQMAIERDPHYAPAHAAIGFVWGGRAHMGMIPSQDAVRRGRPHIDRALALDPASAEAHFYAAVTALYCEWDWAGAQREVDLALALNPNIAEAHQTRADLLLIQERRSEAVEELERALDLDPLNAWTETAVGGRYLRAGREQEGLALLEKALQSEPQFALAHQYVWSASHRAGSFDEASTSAARHLALKGYLDASQALLGEHAQRGYRQGMMAAAVILAERARETYVQPTLVAALYMSAGARSEALDWIERGLKLRDTWLVFLKDDPRFEDLHGDVRFKDAVRRMQFPA
jgi:TolB-like protein/tetratricopeptide (TPR) repeat protein